MKKERTLIDSHCHLYFHTDENGTDFRQVLAAYQKRSGWKAFNICAIPIYADLGPEQNILAALCKLHNPTAYAYAGLVYPEKPFRKPMPDGTDPLTQYQELMQIGFDGIKMLETKPYEQKQYGVCIDDSYFDGLFAACERDGTHMIWHVADPETFWDRDRIPQRFLERGWFYGDGTYMSLEQMYAQVFHVLQKHPQLRVTFAHFFFLSESPEKLEEMFKKYPGTGIDLTPGSEMYASFRQNRDHYREFFIRHADRIMYGTDTSFKGGDMERFYQRGEAVCSFVTTDQDVTVITESCKGLDLPAEVADKILYRNFEAAAGKTPKPIDEKALKAYVLKYQSYIKDPQMRAHILEEIKAF